MVLSALLMVSIFSLSLISEPELTSPVTVSVPVDGLKLNAVAVVLTDGV
jgi:hypothetical protein